MYIPRGRRSIRLKGYDYSKSGIYDITICAHGRICLFGEIERKQMILNQLGRLVNEDWQKLKKHWPHVDLMECIVMPNHLHGILVIKAEKLRGLGTINRAPTNKVEMFGKPTEGSIPTILRLFKAGITRQVGESTAMRGIYGRIWQKGYYEHIIRSEEELRARILYIKDNPKNWDKDPHYSNV